MAKEFKITIRYLRFLNALTRYFVVAVIILSVIFSALHLFIMINGKTLLIKKLEEVTGKKVTVGFFSLTLPLNLHITNLDIENLLKIKEVHISPSFIYLFTGKIALNKVILTEPELIFENKPAVKEAQGANKEVSLDAEGNKEENIDIKIKSPASVNAFNPRILIRKLAIKNGKIEFMDNSVGENGLKVTIKNINSKITNLSNYSSPRRVTDFDLSATIPWSQGKKDGSISAEGWLNFAKKNMEATLSINDIDGVYFYPYYSNWVDLEKARIQSATLNFTSNIQGLNNNVTAECRLELADIVRKERSPDEPKEKAEKIADAIFGLFKAMNQGKIVLDFTIRTKMDSPEFGFGNIKVAVENKIAEARRSSSGALSPEGVIAFPGKLLQGAVKSATDLTKAVIDGSFAVGKELKGAVEDSFKKEKKEE